MKTIEDKVLDVVLKLAVIKEITGVEQALLELGFDSLKKVELIIQIENEFETQFDDSELNPANFRYVKDLVDLVNRHI